MFVIFFAVDYGCHPYHWLLFDRILQQLVLQTESGDDVDVTQLEINVKEIVQLLATEQELLAAQQKADDLERENSDLVNSLTLKEQELDLRTQEKARMCFLIIPTASIQVSTTAKRKE